MRSDAARQILLQHIRAITMAELLDEWTSRTLAPLQRYLSAFSRAAQASGFSAAYIDAFTGANYCAADDTDSVHLGGFAELAQPMPKAFLKHAVRTALSTEPAFDGYMFIERDQSRRNLLEAVGHEFRHRNVQIRRSEVNREIERISRLDWHIRRAVLFVDAYAANLEWDTVITVSRTQTIDLWLLLPLGFGTAQPAPGCVVPRPWRDRVSHLLHSQDWLGDLDTPSPHVDRCVTTLNRAFEGMLQSTFSRVTPPTVLRSPSGSPLYGLFFASSAPGNEATIAVDLASQLLAEIAG